MTGAQGPKNAEGEEGFFENAGEFVGGVQGAVTGAAAGSLLGPVGLVGGGELGAETGVNVGEAIGGAADDAVSWAGDRISDAGGWLQDNAGNIADGAPKVVNPIGGGLFEEVTGGGFSELQKRAEVAQKRVEDFGKAEESLASGGAVSTSDELLDNGKHGLEFFEDFLPLYQDWKGGGPDYQSKIVHEYDQVRGIDFGAFRADAERLTSARGTLHEQNESMNHAFRGAKQTWKGEAAEAAGGEADAYNQGGATVVQDAEAFAGAITPAIDGIQEAVRAYAQFVLELGRELECAGKAVGEAQDEIRKARGDINMSDLGDVGIDDVFSGAWSVIKDAAIGVIVGGPIGGLIGQFMGAKEAAEDIRKGLIEDAKKWLDESFVPEMQQKYDQFQQQSSGLQEGVQAAYDNMLKAAEVQEDPFRGMREDEGGDSQQSQQPTGTGGGGGGGGTPGGGGGGMPGGGMPGGEMPQPPEMPSAEPPGAGGQGRSEEVTLGEGEDAVTVREPDQQGLTEVTVIGEDGQPKTYDVSFGPEGGAGQPTVGTMPAPGQPVPGQAGVGTMPASADGQPISGQLQASQASGTPVQADQNGKAVIEEGDRTIVLEQTPEGGVKVSVDNGQGQPPMNQTIDFGDDAAAFTPPPGGEEPGTPPQVGGFDASPGGVPAELGTPPQTGGYDAVGAAGAESVPAAAGGASAFAGGGADAPADLVPGGPAATSSQSAGMTSMSGFGEGMQNSFGSATGQLLGTEDRGGAQDPPSSQDRGASGMASLGDPGAGGPQGASGMASMGDSGGGAQSGQGSGQVGMAGGGMMGMGGMAGGQQQGGEQERTNSSPWRTQGQLFDDGIEASNVRFNSILGEDRGR